MTSHLLLTRFTVWKVTYSPHWSDYSLSFVLNPPRLSEDHTPESSHFHKLSHPFITEPSPKFLILPMSSLRLSPIYTFYIRFYLIMNFPYDLFVKGIFSRSWTQETPLNTPPRKYIYLTVVFSKATYPLRSPQFPYKTLRSWCEWIPSEVDLGLFNILLNFFLLICLFIDQKWMSKYQKTLVTTRTNEFNAHSY